MEKGPLWNCNSCRDRYCVIYGPTRRIQHTITNDGTEETVNRYNLFSCPKYRRERDRFYHGKT